MSQWEQMVKDALGELNLPSMKTLLSSLKKIESEASLRPIAAQTARFLVKGIDEVVKVAVKNLTTEEAGRLTLAYVNAIKFQLEDLARAVHLYAPEALQVEIAKDQYGSNSEEANAARKRRDALIQEMREEVRDLLKVVVGKDPAD